MDVARPYTAVCPTLDGEVLRVLAGTTMLLTGREVARLAGRNSHSGVLNVLNRLTEHGLVTRVELNRAFLYALNRDHLAAPAVDILAGMREELLSRVRREFGEWQIAPVHVSLFGSAARGDGDTRSDIDLLVIRASDVDEDEPAWRAQIDGLSDQIQRWTGNYAGIVERTESQIARLSADELPILAELRSDAIVLSGSDIPTLLAAA
ncbi:MAG: nucleotidyltransferase domain-containing protein [Solirubrobacteraceae bacterium]|jgi:predicted nucleotidyltransferase